MIGGGRPLLRENLADTDPPACGMAIFDLFSPVAPIMSVKYCLPVPVSTFGHT